MTLLSSEPWTLDTLVVDVANSPKWDRQINGRKVQCLNGGVIIQRRAAMPRQVQLDVVLTGTDRSLHLSQLETLWADNTGSFLVQGPGVRFSALIDPEVHWAETWQNGLRWVTIGLVLSGGITYTSRY